MSSKILDAASSSVRLSILRLLSHKGQLQYTELMFAVNLDPVRDAGKFVYHLKSLIDVGLLKLDKKSKKYSLTELGEIVVKFSRDLEEYLAVKKGRLFVRTSKLAIEEFDRSKIVDSLAREAGVPLELARDIAAEAEDRLMNTKTRHLTAPLIREFINFLLLEKGLEEYRHRLTRLGMPVYDVTQVIEETGRRGSPVSAVKEAASSSVLKEYVLLKGVPREVADAHLSGLIHIDTAESWLLKPESISYDLRSYLISPDQVRKIPDDLNGVLKLLEKIYRRSTNEVTSGEVLPFLNLILAPFVAGLEINLVEKLLRIFIEDLNEEALINPFTPRVSIGVSLKLPRELESESAPNPRGEDTTYGDFHEEAVLLASIILKQAYRISSRMPLLNPLLTVKLKGGDEESLETLSALEAAHGSIYLDFTGDTEAVYHGNGIRLCTGWSGDWHADILRTGQAGTVFLNLSRIALESRGNFERFRKISDDAVRLAVEALKAKRASLIEHLRGGLLPTLKSFNFSVEDSQYGIGILGLSEAASIYAGSAIGTSDKALEFSLKILKYLSELTSASSKELDMRINLVQKPCEEGSSRLAKLDLESFGRGATKFQGLKSNPYYTDVPIIPSKSNVPLEARGELEGKFQQYLDGGHLCLFRLSEAEPKAIGRFSAKLESMDIRFATYSKELSHCKACMTLTQGLIQICPICGSSSIQRYGASSALLKPLKIWPSSNVKEMDEWVRYPIK